MRVRERGRDGLLFLSKTKQNNTTGPYNTNGIWTPDIRSGAVQLMPEIYVAVLPRHTEATLTASVTLTSQRQRTTKGSLAYYVLRRAAYDA